MGHSGRSPVFEICLVLTLATASQAQEGGRITGRWLGQDRNDHCGALTDGIKPNGYQDIHIGLAGLPPRGEIVFAKILGFGSDEWQYKGVQNQHGVVILRKPGSHNADLFFEPNHAETGRAFTISLKFQDGSEVNVDVQGGVADPNLRMPELALSARWIGQERQDLAGNGPGVGPDGLQDVRIDLAKLIAGTKVKAALIEEGQGPGRWAFGVNHEGLASAEFLQDDKEPTRGSLFFQAGRDLSGRKLKVTVTYESGKKDSALFAAGRCDPKLAMPKLSLPKVLPFELKARWLGQDGSAETGRGDVHLALSGLPVRRPIVAVVLSDGVRGVWAFRSEAASKLDVEGDALPLAFRRGSNGATADLYFGPIRDESNTPLTVRLVFADGESSVSTIPGGLCNPAKRAPELEKTERIARPGDDLAVLVERGGTLRLSKGEYRLSKPLVLNKPLTLSGEPGAVLTFAQGDNDAPWTTAIKIHAGNTTLRDFSVRFAGPIRWRNDVSWSPAVIGTTDNFDGIPSVVKHNLAFVGLDLEGPPPSGKTPLEESVKLMRLTNAAGGRIEKNVLRGGLVEFFGGPWRVIDNDYRGTAPGTFSYAVFAAHEPYDLVLKDNKAKSVGPSGKSWRFLGLTGRGYNDLIENNVMEGLGPRDDDTMTGFNAPEIMITESYYLWFEGKPGAISADGRLVKVGSLKGMAPRTGDVVSVVSGPGAGQWRRIAQRIEPTVYYLEAPLPKGSDVIAISPGFIDDVWRKNIVDARGGRGAAALVLDGNHFGIKVLQNRFLGAGDAFRIEACACEAPNVWGWSHVPFFGVLIESNIIEDSERGGTLGVNHGDYIKSNKGRVYLTATLKDNIVRWSESFLARLAKSEVQKPAAGILLGFPGSIDPGEMVVTQSGDRLEAPSRAPAASALRVNAAVLNGRATTNRALGLPVGQPAASTGRTGVESSRR